MTHGVGRLKTVTVTVNGYLAKDELQLYDGQSLWKLSSRLFCQHLSFAEPVFMFKPRSGRDGSKRGSQVMLLYSVKVHVGGEVEEDGCDDKTSAFITETDSNVVVFVVTMTIKRSADLSKVAIVTQMCC